jgi:transcription termination factor Rho
VSVLDRKQLEDSPLADLHAIASELGIEGYRRLRKAELINLILGEEAPPPAEEPEPEAEPEPEPERKSEQRQNGEQRGEREAARRDEPEEEEELRTGVLDILPNGSGFMRDDPFAHSRDDVYVSPAQIRRCELRSGDTISGPVRKPRRSERHPSIVRIDSVNGQPPEPPAQRPDFKDLTPVFATQRISAPTDAAAPFGHGSRVAVAGPAGSGATTLLRQIAKGIADAGGDVELTVVLTGIRPEEVTDWRDAGLTVVGGGFDRPHEEQAQMAEMALERAKRRVELGGRAVIVLDSLDALPPGAARRIFGAARNTKEGGSLTVIAATGSAGEPLRQATTRIVLDQDGTVSSTSGTLRSELLA